MNVCLFCCSLYLVHVLIVVIMGRWSEFSACIVCQIVRLYSVVEIVVMSGVVCGTLVDVLSVCAYGGVVGYLRCFSFLHELCFLYCDDVRLGAVY